MSMMTRAWMLSAAAAVAMVAAPATAATTINYTVSAQNFDGPLAPNLVARFIFGNGSLSYTSGLADGTYGIAELSTFSLDLTRKFFFNVAPAERTASYHWSLADLTAFSLTLSGGQPTAASWTLTPKKAATTDFAALADQYFTMSFSSGDDPSVSFYVGSSSTAMSRAATGDLERVAAVPEPASWALMLAGLGLTGAAVRRRKVTARFA